MENQKQSVVASYKDLRIYQRSYDLALEIHKISAKFPMQERRELCNQLRRAATSVPINITGSYWGKRTPKNFKSFLVISFSAHNKGNVNLSFSWDLGDFQRE